MKKIAYFLSILIMTTLHGQNLSLEECVTKALSTHPDVKKAALQLQYSQQGLDVARADYLPQVTLNGEYDPTKTYAIPQNGLFTTKENDGWSVGATLNQKIWDFSKTLYAIKAQGIQEEISALNLKEAQAFLAYQVKLQYELMVVQREAIRVRENDLKAKEALYAQAQEFVKYGMKTTADSTRFLSSVYVAKDNLNRARADFDKARTVLSHIINEPIESDVILSNTLTQNTSQTQAQESILEYSPSLRALQKQVTKNELTYQSINASHYGSLDAIASYARQNSLSLYDTTLVGITLKIPLYSGGRISALVEQAQITKQISKEELNSKTLTLKTEFENTLVDLQRSQFTIETKVSQFKAAVQTQALIEGRYQEGLATYLEVLDAAALTLEAELGLLQGEFERSGAYHKLNYLQGKIL
jgi:outer membrane protein TolC